MRFLRLSRGLRQKEIANILGISQSRYSFLERCPKYLMVIELEKLADFFNMDIHEIFKLVLEEEIST